MSVEERPKQDPVSHTVLTLPELEDSLESESEDEMPTFSQEVLKLQNPRTNAPVTHKTVVIQQNFNFARPENEQFQDAPEKRASEFDRADDVPCTQDWDCIY